MKARQESRRCRRSTPVLLGRKDTKKREEAEQLGHVRVAGKSAEVRPNATEKRTGGMLYQGFKAASSRTRRGLRMGSGSHFPTLFAVHEKLRGRPDDC